MAGINPITIRGKEGKPNVSLGRIWIKDPDLKKKVTILIWDSKGSDEEPNIFGRTVIDEEEFIRALGHLFPNGELGENPLSDELILKNAEFFTRGKESL